MSDRCQEWFNTIVRGFERQGWKPSFDKRTNRCLYRGPEGTKCALGHLIDDDNPMCDSKLGISSRNYDRFGFGELTDNEFWFLSRVQRVHDDAAYENSYLKQRMVEFAVNNGLDWPAEVSR